MSTKKKQPIILSEPLLVRNFGLTRLRPPSAVLHNWLQSSGKLDTSEQQLLAKVCTNLLDNADSWNEEELKMHFISVIILLVNFKHPLRVYFDREISVEVENTFIKTEADMLVSKGYGDIIENPYFFLHEYKREKKYTGDPIGQMLGGMLIAQAQNNDGQPVHGGYVQGRFWFFAILNGKEYVISQPLNAAEYADAEKIVYMLQYIKTLYK